METLIEEDLPMQIDSISWQNPTTLAVGAYQLVTNQESKRIGRIYVIVLTPEIPGGFTVTHEQQTKGGVLDLKFNEDELLVATSECVCIYRLTTELTLVTTIDITCMALYTHWIDNNSFLYSDTDGFVNCVERGNGGFSLARRKKVHETFTWVVHYSSSQEMVYSGSDDGKFTCFELTELLRDEVHLVRNFPMGVVSVSTKDELVFVGSYDDCLYLFSLTQKSPKPVLVQMGKIEVGGAPWRTQILPSLTSSDNLTIACACARNGIQIIDYNRLENKLEVVFKFSKYEGCLAYALDVLVDWKLFKYTFATGYFDNHVVHLFRY